MRETQFDAYAYVGGRACSATHTTEESHIMNRVNAFRGWKELCEPQPAKGSLSAHLSESLSGGSPVRGLNP